MESRLRMLIVLAGLPEPEVNREVLDAHGRLLHRFDLSHPHHKILVEYEARQHREDLDQWDHDTDRRDWLDAHRPAARAGVLPRHPPGAGQVRAPCRGGTAFAGRRAAAPALRFLAAAPSRPLIVPAHEQLGGPRLGGAAVRVPTHAPRQPRPGGPAAQVRLVKARQPPTAGVAVPAPSAAEGAHARSLDRPRWTSSTWMKVPDAAPGSPSPPRPAARRCRRCRRTRPRFWTHATASSWADWNTVSTPRASADQRAGPRRPPLSVSGQAPHAGGLGRRAARPVRPAAHLTRRDRPVEPEARTRGEGSGRVVGHEHRERPRVERDGRRPGAVS